ncbi:tRNA 2-selenouridine(34) synthase MnmH [Anaeroselena agilis]|uniref:tRNA 2-selenouridine(34) synthase MnmH n=1 Tax=Anaeroselena agilis TaxID=3063788 RepID=A0ABU3NX25_9FIRM|nr:tRNA 2-selenouridine(34) synthase MnmH [Selenomonadales bacterium 4137-cl]
MDRVIDLADALKLDNPIFIDMRSPSEFANGAIPGAVNIPLLDDAERSVVGTIYKLTGPEEAKQQGLALVSAKLPELVGNIRAHHRVGREVVVYCWRGGMRSKSVVGILEIMGIPAYQLLGGYKAYRRYVLEALEAFALNPPVVTLCGSTGVGKTTLLKLLKERGAPVIDLEQLANHRGSVFGSVGLGKSATAQNFDAVILQELNRYKDAPYILVECESKRIGNVYLPDVLFAAMKKGPKILAFADIETRVTRLIDEYLDVYNHRREEIIASIQALRKRLGAAKSERLLAAFAAGEVRDVVRTLLTDYYDPLYGYEKADPGGYAFTVDAADLARAADGIIDYLNTLRGDIRCRQ